jgi:lipoate-protein ligase A
LIFSRRTSCSAAEPSKRRPDSIAISWLDLTLPTLAENLALDEALLLEAEEGRAGELLRLWEWPHPAVVLGAACRLAEDVDEAACLRDGVPILRRSSGGGTVLLGPGCLLFSLVLAYDRHPALTEILSSYRYILEQVGASLTNVLPDVAVAGTSDLACGGRKLSGNAQQRKRTHLLHHGTLLYGFNAARVARYLRQPARQPNYRQQRGHEAFLMNVPLARMEIERRLRQAWLADEPLATWPQERVRVLTATKYARPEWVRRR